MKKYTFLFFLLCIFFKGLSQFPVTLNLKNNGKLIKKYYKGDPIIIITNYHQSVQGVISNMFNDSLFINQIGFSLKEIIGVKKIIYKKSVGMSAEQYGLIALGSLLMATGVYVAGWEDLKTSATYGLAIGFGPIIVNKLVSSASILKRKKYMLGNKFQLQILDLQIHP